MSVRYSTLNQFYKGMNQDIGVDKLQNEFYYYMLNGTIIDQDSPGSSLSPQNIKGNKLFVTIPSPNNVWRLFTNFFPGDSYNFDITINGIVTNVTGTYIDSSILFEKIKNAIQSNNLNNSLNLNISYNSNLLTIFSSSVDLTISVNIPEIQVFEYLQKVLDPKIIGWETINDDIYILTTNETSNNPSGSNGQIWRLTYNKITLSPTITLIYNSKLNFSTFYPIANPGGIVGIYENENIQRLYFTDRNNKLRQVNVADPNLMSLDPENIDLSPSVDFSVPKLIKVETGGSLTAGVYWGAYRLKNSLTGSLTSFSPVSFPVNIVVGNEAITTGGNNYVDYKGANKGTNCNKTIIWEIDNIDDDFSELEFLVIKKEDYNSSGEYLLLNEVPVTSSKRVKIVFSGNENFITITNSEFNALSNIFTHCKSIATKDNILYAANTYSKKLELLDFDSRCYRAKDNSGVYEFQVKDSSGSLSTINPILPFNIPENHDSINPDHDIYKYDINGDIGGTGPYISYTFGVVAVKADDITVIQGPPGSNPYSVRHTNQNYNTSQFTENIKDINNDDIYYPLNNINEGTKFVYYSSPLRQFQRGEIYRFGFQGYNKSKDPYFVKWIGDIKMPLPGDPLPPGNGVYIDGTPIPSNINDFRLSFVSGNTTYTCFLYVKFTINLPPNVSSVLSGYNIVRVERTENDKTILGCGILTNTELDVPAGTSYYPVRIDKNGNFTRMNASSDDPGLATNIGASKYAFLFDSPDHQLVSYPNFAEGDKLKVIGTLSLTSEIESNSYRFIKNYQFFNLYNDDYDIAKTISVSFGKYVTDIGGPYPSGYSFRNFSKEYDNSTSFQVDDVESVGNKTLLVLLKSSSPLSSVGGYGCNNLNGRKMLAYYTRQVTNQYGGNDYSSRTLNEYIQCSPFRSISSTSFVVDTFKCFGGDTYVTIYDQQKLIKHWGGNQTTELDLPSDDGPPDNNPYTPASNKKSLSMFFPVESYCNPDLRHGIHPNVGMFGSDNGTHAQYLETYDYNQVYSSETNFTKYFHKPLIFIPVNKNTNRIHASSPKILGELEDSWSNFPANQFLDVDGVYGEINNLCVIKNKLVFFQDNAIGVALSNEKLLMKDAVNDDFILGYSGILSGKDYISSSIGTKHQFSFAKSYDESVIFLDINKKEYYFIESNLKIVPVTGLNSYLNSHLKGDISTNDNPYLFKGVTSGWDHKNKQFITSVNISSNIYVDNVRIKPFCFSYCPSLKTTHSFYSYNTPVFIKDNNNIFNVSSDLRSIWIMNKGDRGRFFNVIHPFRVDFIVNDGMSIEKIFDNFELNTVFSKDTFIDNDEDTITIDQKDGTFTSYRCYNNYQNTNWIPLIKNQTIKRDKRRWNIAISGNRVKYLNNTNFDIFDPNNLYVYPDRYFIPQRLKSNYLFVNLQYDNLSNNKLILEDIKTTYRINRLNNIPNEK